MRKVRYYQVQIDLQTYPDGEWNTVVVSDAFEDETDARRWMGHYTVPPLPQGWDVRTVMATLDSHKEPLEDIENIYERG